MFYTPEAKDKFPFHVNVMNNRVSCLCYRQPKFEDLLFIYLFYIVPYSVSCDWICLNLCYFVKTYIIIVLVKGILFGNIWLCTRLFYWLFCLLDDVHALFTKYFLTFTQVIVWTTTCWYPGSKQFTQSENLLHIVKHIQWIFTGETNMNMSVCKSHFVKGSDILNGCRPS